MKLRTFTAALAVSLVACAHKADEGLPAPAATYNVVTVEDADLLVMPSSTATVRKHIRSGQRVVMVGRYEDYAYVRDTESAGFLPLSAVPAELVRLAPVTNEGRVLYVGPRGGCYYVSEAGNKVYVERGLCSDSETKAQASSRTSTPKAAGSSGGTVNVKGYTRKTKSGKTVTVKPHTRKAPRKR